MLAASLPAWFVRLSQFGNRLEIPLTQGFQRRYKAHAGFPASN
jgi:hypothetical protein